MPRKKTKAKTKKVVTKKIKKLKISASQIAAVALKVVVIIGISIVIWAEMVMILLYIDGAVYSSTDFDIASFNTLRHGRMMQSLRTFEGPNGFTFQCPRWSNIPKESLPYNSFNKDTNLLLMSTDNRAMQYMALETKVDAKKNLSQIIDEDIKREAAKVSQLETIKKEVQGEEANIELTYLADGQKIHMFAREFLVKNTAGTKVYSIIVQIAEKELANYQKIYKAILDSAKILIP